MQIGKINKGLNIKFCQNQENISSPPKAQKETEKIAVTSLPPNFVNVNTPISYSKINEFTLPKTDIKVQIYKLANGQTVVLAPKKGETQINTYVKCGSMNEQEHQRGISHFIEHNLFNGSNNINPKEFFGLVNKIGAYTNAWTSEFGTSYLIKSQLFDSEDLSKIIALHSDMIQYPKFEQSQIDKERGVVNSEITMYDDNNYRVMSGKAFKQLFQINSNSNDIVGGTVANINNLTREDVISYYNKNYTPDKMITVLTGEFNPEEAIELISKNFTKPAKTSQEPQYNVELNPIQTTKRIDYNSKNINTDEFVIGFSGPKNSDLKETISTEIALSILSGKSYSKLDKNLKEFNITPMVNISQTGNQPSNPAFIEVGGSCNPKDTQKVLQKIYSTIHNAKYEDLKNDLSIAKKMLHKNIQQAFETGNTINSFLGNYLSLYTPNQIQKIPEIIDSINEEDIKNSIEKYLDLNKASIVVSHPKTDNNSLAFKGKIEKTGIDLHNYKYAKLQNNTEIYLQKSHSELKDFVLNIRTELPANVNPQLSMVLTKLLNKGANYQSEEDFAKDLSEHAGTLYFSAGANGITVGGNALENDAKYALNKAIDTINHPKFTQKDLDEARSQIKQQILEKNKYPTSYIDEVMFPELKTASTQEQELKNLEEIQLGDVLGLMEYIRKNSSAYFAWNKDEIPYELNNLGLFKPSNIQELNTYRPLSEDVLKVQQEESGQAKIIQAFKFKQEKSPKEIAKLKILNSILGGQQSSRLFTDLRETQKLAYSTRSSIEQYGNTGIIVLSIGTTTDNPQDATATSSNITKSLEGFKRNIEKLKNQNVTEEELETAKLTIKANILNMLETNSGKINKVLEDVSKIGNINFTNELLKEIDNVTIEDVKETAQKVFEGHSLTSIVASQKTLDELNLH